MSIESNNVLGNIVSVLQVHVYRNLRVGLQYKCISYGGSFLKKLENQQLRNYSEVSEGSPFTWDFLFLPHFQV